jgi:regulator of sigma E protease
VRSNDIILAIYARNEKLSYTTPEGVVNFVKAHQEDNISVVYKSSLTGYISTTTVKAVFGITEGKKSIGMSVGEAGYIDFDFFESFQEGLSDTYKYSKLTLFGLGDVVAKLFKGESVSEYLTGPIGIAKLVGTATADGLAPLLFMVALLSINLAVFNLLPLPALDGGRIMFVIYEMITRKAINFKLQYYINAIGFFGLLLLTLVVTYFDVMR